MKYSKGLRLREPHANISTPREIDYQRWIAHFQANRLGRKEPEWDAPIKLNERKRLALVRSLAEYQLGDGGGPCCLIARDATALRASGAEVRQVIDLWFAEEREHSRLLAGAVRRLRGTLVRETLAFRLFCGVRKALGVQFEMLVLLLVEIVSTGYYRLICAHAEDPPIAAMCKLILRDEAGHIAFHRDRLAARYPQGITRVWELMFHTLGNACAAFLWLGHRRDFRAMGATRGELFRHVQSGLHVFLRKLKSNLALSVPAPSYRHFQGNSGLLSTH